MRRFADDEAGFAGGFAGLLFGTVLFVVGTLLVAYAWSVVELKSATVDAARQAARTFVEASDPAMALSEARQSAAATLLAHGRKPANASVTLVSGSFGRCQRITISVTYPGPKLLLPLVGSVRLLGGRAVRAQHSELVDPYHSGLPGSAACT